MKTGSVRLHDSTTFISNGSTVKTGASSLRSSMFTLTVVVDVRGGKPSSAAVTLNEYLSSISRSIGPLTARAPVVLLIVKGNSSTPPMMEYVTDSLGSANARMLSTNVPSGEFSTTELM